MRKPSSTSTGIGARSIDENDMAVKNVPQENVRSPIRWGYLGAAIAHLACIFITGLPSSHPWVCLHGSVHVALTLVLGYIVWAWNSRFNNDTYVRRELMRFSFAVISALVGLLCGQSALVVGFYGAPEGAPEGDETNDGDHPDCPGRETAYGCMSRMSLITPIVYGVMTILWMIFAYVQYVALSNIESLRPRVPEMTTIGQEMQNSVAAGNHHRQLINTCQSGHPSTYFYIFTLIPATCLWAFSLTYLGEQTILAVAATLSATVMLMGLVSPGMRSNLIAIISQVGFLGMGIVGFILAFGESDHTSVGARVTAATLVVVCQLVGLAAASFRYQNHRTLDRGRHEAAPEHFFRSNANAQDPNQVADPIDFFAAGVAGKEKSSSPV